MFTEELEAKMPSRAYLSSFSSDGMTASMSITCSTKEEAGSFIETLRDFDSVASVSVTSIAENVDELTGLTTVTFSAAIIYRPVEPMDYSGLNGASSEEDEYGEEDTDSIYDEEFYDYDEGIDEDVYSEPYQPDDEGGIL